MRASGILAVMWLVGAFSAPAPAQVTQQSKLAGSIEGIQLGLGLALSANGKTALLGGWSPILDGNPPGAANVAFARADEVWTQQMAQFGAGPAVALSGNGYTALIGEPFYGYDLGIGVNGSGAAKVYTRTAGAWTEQVTLIGTHMPGQAGDQGISVALSRDGNTALVGGSDGSNPAGGAWVFIRTAGVWTQQAGLVGSDAIGAAGQGVSVALSGDGNTALVGGLDDNNGAGAAWVFIRTAGIWSQQAKLVGSDAIGVANQGQAVALSFNGNRAMIGGPIDNNNAGAAWLFRRAHGVWTQQAKLVGSDAVGAAGQGSSVALAGDGTTALVGGPDDNDDAGAAWLYTVVGRSWTQQGSKLVGTGAIGAAEQGTRVALSRDGSTILVSGPRDDPITVTSYGFPWPLGAAWVFTQPVYAGMPGTGQCVAQSVEPLIRQYRGLNNAAQAMGFANVSTLESAILGHCREGS